jgi:hypothetical protein
VEGLNVYQLWGLFILTQIHASVDEISSWKMWGRVRPGQHLRNLAGRQFTVALVLQSDTATTKAASALHEIGQLARGGTVVQTLRANVGYAVALGIAASHPRCVGGVDAQAVR